MQKLAENNYRGPTLTMPKLFEDRLIRFSYHDGIQAGKSRVQIGSYNMERDAK